MRKDRLARISLCLLLAVSLTACALPTNAPLDVLRYRADMDGAPNQRLFVFMRGMGGSHRSFEKERLVDDMRARRLPFDMVAPNAHFGYYSGRTLVHRLKADVIDPALEQGYREIWLIGFSMGGLGSLLYRMEHPEDITGVCLIASFLGYGAIIKEIAAAGGVRRWEPGLYDPTDDWQRMLWHWLKSDIADDPACAVYLGFGTRDTYRRGQELLSAVLPADSVYTVDGGHDYPTFLALWRMFLDSNCYYRHVDRLEPPGCLRHDRGSVQHR
jgi:pimeloyl-ACP methyl ester carboxylesterase